MNASLDHHVTVRSRSITPCQRGAEATIMLTIIVTHNWKCWLTSRERGTNNIY